ncbi:unnamed protein product [Caenorhabditis angaria]|uniref:Uncharacterized protein n=1 Tax=Caenorhabditis angaria TaxID=860376 RepID=A0A9P1N7G6_9PELO|nr:unnamed protein product [Caenorhabditis angaria]
MRPQKIPMYDEMELVPIQCESTGEKSFHPCDSLTFTSRDNINGRRMEIRFDETSFGSLEESYGKRVVDQFDPKVLIFDDKLDLCDLDRKWLANRKSMVIWFRTNTRIIDQYLQNLKYVTKLEIETKQRIDLLKVVKAMKKITVLKITGNKNTYCTNEALFEIVRRSENLECIHLELSKDSTMDISLFRNLAKLKTNRGLKCLKSYGGYHAIIVFDRPGSDIFEEYDSENMHGSDSSSNPDVIRCEFEDWMQFY